MRKPKHEAQEPRTAMPARHGENHVPATPPPVAGLPRTRKVRRRKSAAIPAVFTPEFWSEQDGRITVSREIRRRVQALRDDAGIDSTQKELLAQRAVFISLQLETAEVKAAQTGEFDPGVYTQMVNTLTGLLRAIGLERKAQDAGGLKRYWEGRP